MTETITTEQYWQTYGRSVKARQSQRTGAKGEEIAERALRAYGIEMVEQITTPFVITNKMKGGWVKIKRKKKVSGDRRGVMGDGSGRRVLAEVKSTSGDRIQWSRLEDHQVRALDKNNRLNAVSLLVVSFTAVGTYVLRWPVRGFGPGTSITAEMASENQWDGES